MASGAACHSSTSGGSAVPTVAPRCRAVTCRRCRPIQVAHSDTVGKCSLKKQLSLEEQGVGLRRPSGSMKVPLKSASKGVELPGASLSLVSRDPPPWSGQLCTSVGSLAGVPGPLQERRRMVERYFTREVRENFECLETGKLMKRWRTVSLSAKVSQNPVTSSCRREIWK